MWGERERVGDLGRPGIRQKDGGERQTGDREGLTQTQGAGERVQRRKRARGLEVCSRLDSSHRGRWGSQFTEPAMAPRAWGSLKDQPGPPLLPGVG